MTNERSFPIAKTLPGVLYYNPASEDGARWVEYPEQGLRLVDRSHEIVNLKHSGHYIDVHQDETYSGVVYQLPSKHRKERYLAGHSAPWNDAALIDFSTIYDDKESAAYAADRLAEKHAENEREYSEAATAGMNAWELWEEAESLQEELDNSKVESEVLRATIESGIDEKRRECVALYSHIYGQTHTLAFAEHFGRGRFKDFLEYVLDTESREAVAYETDLLTES